MIKLYLMAVLAAIAFSCHGDLSQQAKELELREKEIELKEREAAFKNKESHKVENTESIKPQKTQEELKRELALKECETPTAYLRKTNGSMQGMYKNALSLKFNGFKIKFKVQNSASVITFKNVKCRIKLTSDSGLTILMKNFTVTEFIPAGRSAVYKGEFECTNQQFKDTDSYTIEILGAECH